MPFIWAHGPLMVLLSSADAGSGERDAEPPSGLALVVGSPIHEAPRRIARAGGTPVQAVPFPPAEAQPLVVTGGSLVPCPGPGYRGDPDAAAAAQELILAGEDQLALQALDAALGGLACGPGAVTPAGVARLHYLRGVALFDLGEREPASQAFAQARALAAGLAWDAATFGPEGREIFDDARPRPTAPFHILPPLTGGEARVDGVAVPSGPEGLDLPLGPHLVQLGSAPTFVVEAKGPCAVIRTSQLAGHLPRWADDPAWHPSLSGVVDELAPGPAVWLVSPEGTWRRDADTWKRVDSSPGTGGTLRNQLLAAGVAGLVVGALGSAVGGVEMWSASRWATTSDRSGQEVDAHEVAVRRHQVGSALLIGGASVSTIGAGVVTAGFALPQGSR